MRRAHADLEMPRGSASYSLFGLALASDFAFGSRLARASGVADLDFSCSTQAPREVRWDGLTPVFESRDPAVEDGESVADLYRFEDCEVLRFLRVADFYLWRRRIVCHLLDSAHRDLAEIQLLGPVLSYWLERRGIPALHASAVVVEGSAVAFLASNGGGKTALAAALMQAGHPLLTDDILPLEERRGTFVGRPGYPQMRMWPDEAMHFMGDTRGLEAIHLGHRKRRIPVGSGGPGAFLDVASSLDCLYLPVRRADVGTRGAVDIEPVGFGDAVIELVRNSFIPFLVEAVGLQPQRLSFFARLVAQVPMRRLSYPSGFDRLPKVAGAILEDVSRRRHGSDP